MTKMPKIRGFQNVWKSLQYRATQELSTSSVSYASKIKLHGTNAGIRISSDKITAQKKSADVLPGDPSHFGFEIFVESLKESWLEKTVLYRNIKYDCLDTDLVEYTIMGEWAGPGVQKSVGVSLIPEKTFFVFAIFIKSIDEDGVITTNVIHDPKTILYALSVDGFSLNENNIRVLPYYSKVKIPLRDSQAVSKILREINEEVINTIEPEDPYIAEKFGVYGVGEGLVFFPTHTFSKSYFEEYSFKVKGPKHAVNKAGKPARMKSDIPDSAYDFANMHVTEARLEQGLSEVGSDIELTGKFIGWICRDVATESALEIQESGLEWKGCLSGVVATKARNWYLQKVNTI